MSLSADKDWGLYLDATVGVKTKILAQQKLGEYPN
jgi:hypothetical protein